MQGACNVAAPRNLGVLVNSLLPMAESCRTVQETWVDSLHCWPHVIVSQFRQGLASDLQLGTGWPLYSF